MLGRGLGVGRPRDIREDGLLPWTTPRNPEEYRVFGDWEAAGGLGSSRRWLHTAAGDELVEISAAFILSHSGMSAF